MTQPTQELWKFILGRDDYEVSSLGRVRSYRAPGGARGLLSEPRLVSPWLARNGYPMVTLAGRPRSKRYVHHLVAEAFLGPRPNGLDVAHWDGTKTNNALANLRYATKAENMADKLRHGTDNRADHAKFAKLSKADVLAIRKRASSGENQSQIARDFGVCQQTVSLIKRHINWAHLSDDGHLFEDSLDDLSVTMDKIEGAPEGS